MIMKEDVFEALQYFYGAGMIENTYGDQRHYIDILVHFAADKLNVGLVNSPKHYRWEALVYSNCVALTPLRSVRTAFFEGCYTFPLKNWTDSVNINWRADISSIFPHFGLKKVWR